MRVNVQQHRICFVIGLFAYHQYSLTGLFLASAALLNVYGARDCAKFFALVNL